MIGIDLFSGAGGMSVGARRAGIKSRFAVESDINASSTYAAAHPDCTIFCNDIRRLSRYRIKKVPKGDSGTVVFGGPPCQGFSYSNSRTRNAENENNWLFEEFLRVVRVWHPDWVVFENVRGIVDTANGVFLDSIVERFDKLNYSLAFGLLNAKDFGVPQDRTRFFLIGCRHNRKVELPTPIKGSVPTVWDAIRDLPALENGSSESWKNYSRRKPSPYAKTLRLKNKRCPNHLVTRNSKLVLNRYKFVPQGGNWSDIPERLMKNYADKSRCHTRIYHRLDRDAPSVVIGNFRKNMLIHPFEDRGLSVREAARIQSFPDSMEFMGSIGFQQQQVGNAVPPMLAEAVFRQILS